MIHQLEDSGGGSGGGSGDGAQVHGSPPSKAWRGVTWKACQDVLESSIGKATVETCATE
jgi:hypothetical protein